MIPEMQQLAKKVEQVATLVQTLRNENADLHRQLAELATTNADLTKRMQEAHDRMSVVLNNVPFTTQESE